MSDDSSDQSSDSGDFATAAPAPDQVTETTTEGWLQRLGGSLIAALIGLVLVPASVVLLYWNEGRAVDAIRALNRGLASIVAVNAASVDPQANGRLVHVTGTMLPSTAANDPDFKVTGDGLIRLSRVVEMYQWKEESHSKSEKNIGGSKTTETTYTYDRVWSPRPLNSNGFKVPNGHQNPPMSRRSEIFDGSRVRLGAYGVDPSILQKVTNFTPLPAGGTPPPGYQAREDGFYRGRDPEQPAVGDVRVSFKAIQTQIVSVAAAQESGVLTAFHDRDGYTIALVEPGAVPAAALFRDEAKSESTLTWILRAAGFVLVLAGFICVTRPLTMLFAVLPFLESLVGAGAFLVALTLAVPVTLVTIATAWIVHRPLIGGLLLAGALGALFLPRILRRRRPLAAQA